MIACNRNSDSNSDSDIKLRNAYFTFDIYHYKFQTDGVFCL